MRHFEKKETNIPQIFNKWKEENKDNITEWINSDRTGDNLWEQLGKTFDQERETLIESQVLRYELETALFEEQHGLCCYCGNEIKREYNKEKEIWEYFYRAIEHFQPKNKFKDLTFEYNNLMLCCKESQRLSCYEVGREYKGKIIQNIQDIANVFGLSVTTIKSYKKNSKLNFNNLKIGDKIYIPNPPHCDDEKSKNDAKENQLIIINPTEDTERIDKLVFCEKGTITSANQEKDEITENTFNVLSLNCSTLVERRQDKWMNAYINFSDNILIDDSIDLKLIIEKLIEGKSMPNEEGLLEPFYFVEIAFLKSLYS